MNDKTEQNIQQPPQSDGSNNTDAQQTDVDQIIPSKIPTPINSGVRTYAKDMERAKEMYTGQGTPEDDASQNESQIPVPDTPVKDHPGIPLDMVVMHRESETKEEATPKSHAHKTPSVSAPELDSNEQYIPSEESTGGDESLAVETTKESTENDESSVVEPTKVDIDTKNIERPNKKTPLSMFIDTPSEVPSGKIERLKKKISASAITPPPPKLPATNSPIHTYKSDFADHIHETKSKRVDVLVAEQDAPRERRMHSAAPARSHTILFVIGGTLLFAISILGVLYVYGYNKQRSFVQNNQTSTPSLIASESQKELVGSGRSLLHEIAEASKKSIPDGSITVFYQTRLATTSSGISTHVPLLGSTFFANLSMPVPNLLARTIASDSTIGIIHSGKETRPFFILQVNSYDAAFAGMLDWEHTISKDLSEIYPAYPQKPVPGAQSASSTEKMQTASSTKSVSPRTFQDEIVLNHDTRVLRDSNGNSILIYGFRNKHALIIARDPMAFAEIITRLNNSTSK
ncbi:MAG TPA: hypothetical protein ENJ75_00240 [Candidatus Kaiserbacteria bacterium]|nr:hypothetical protein [Candidatus Kaiserbacteria bacterium]